MIVIVRSIGRVGRYRLRVRRPGGDRRMSILVQYVKVNVLWGGETNARKTNHSFQHHLTAHGDERHASEARQ